MELRRHNFARLAVNGIIIKAISMKGKNGNI